MEKKLEKLFKKKNKLVEKYTEKDKELVLQNEVLQETECDMHELQCILSGLYNKKEYAKNCDEILKEEKKKIIIKELITFLTIGVFATLTSLIPMLIGVYGATIPMLISFLGLDALGCTIIGTMDFNEYKQIIKKYNLSKIEADIKSIEKEIELKQFKVDSIKILVNLLKQELSIIKTEQNELDIELNSMNSLVLESLDKIIEENSNDKEKTLVKVK